MAECVAEMTVVLMAKLPRPGNVKTRLQATFSPEQASGIHQAMLMCVIQRLSEAFGSLNVELILALDVELETQIDAEWEAKMGVPVPSGWSCVPQGEGGLGDRLAFVSERLLGGAISRGGIAFFGVDSPDVPLDQLAVVANVIAVPAKVGTGAIAVGPVSDGGYWTLAARPWNDALVANIDWGTSKVYDQTVQVIRRLDLDQVELQAWYDVDFPDDVAALRKRIEGSDEPALQNLAQQLKHICEDVVDD